MHPSNLIRFIPAEGSALVQELVCEFNAVERQAIERLGAGDWLLCLKARPAFSDPLVVGVQRVRPDRAMWRRWNKELDLEAFRSPVERMRHPRPYLPTIQEVSAPLDRARIDTLLRPFGALQLATYVQSNRVGMDGVSYEISIGDYMAASCFRWWGEHPANWRPLMVHFANTWTCLLDILELKHTEATPDFVWS